MSVSGKSPLEQIAAWLEEARAAGEPEPEAMTLATVGAGGVPSARIVLCRGIDERGVRFFTNYESRKGEEITANAAVALVFHWPRLFKQARVEGTAEKVSAPESDDYFASRPHGNQLGAWASPQSQRIESLAALRVRQQELAAMYEGREVPRPPHWGGFVVRPRAIELWVAGADRLHERALFLRAPGGWEEVRLAP